MKIVVAMLLFGSLGRAFAQEVNWGGFVDTYYGYDFAGRAGDRAFTTQSLRHNEFAINLAYLEAKLAAEKIHGRLALQAGTSVYANYSAEANRPLADLTRLLQEAYGGYRVAPDLWVDFGLFFSHIGAESFISKDNWNYTRSLGADYSPYYQSGVRVTYRWSPKWTMQVHVLNGWQNQIETNGHKALGLQIVYSPSDVTSFTYNQFLGREKDTRFFQQLIAKTRLARFWETSLSLDMARENSTWLVVTWLHRWQVGETVALGGRVEYFHDPDQSIVATGTPRGFRTGGASLNVDWQPEPRWLWRNEVRGLWSKDAVFPGNTGSRGNNTLFVTSLSLSF